MRMLELLVARLGPDNVLQALPQADYRPEQANAWVPVQQKVREPGAPRRRCRRTCWPACRARPGCWPSRLRYLMRDHRPSTARRICASCLGLNGGNTFKQSEAFSFVISTDDQAETDRYWNAIVGNGGAESACGWCKDRWGLSWQITPRVLTDAMAQGGEVAKRAFTAMMEMGKIDVARIEAAVRGDGGAA
jgi:hypothetical protein